MKSIYASDATIIYYDDNGIEIEIARLLCDPTDLETMLNLCDVDMDAFAESRGWDSWDWDCLHSRPDYAPGFDWHSYMDGEPAESCWAE